MKKVVKKLAIGIGVAIVPIIENVILLTVLYALGGENFFEEELMGQDGIATDVKCLLLIPALLGLIAYLAERRLGIAMLVDLVTYINVLLVIAVMVLFKSGGIWGVVLLFILIAALGEPMCDFLLIIFDD